MNSKKELLHSLGNIITIIGDSNKNEFKILMDYYNNYCKGYSLNKSINNLLSAYPIICKYNTHIGIDDCNRKYPIIKLHFDDVTVTFTLHDDCSINWIDVDRKYSYSYIYRNCINEYPDGLNTLSILDTCNEFGNYEEVVEYLKETFDE